MGCGEKIGLCYVPKEKQSVYAQIWKLKIKWEPLFQLVKEASILVSFLIQLRASGSQVRKKKISMAAQIH